ncbi:MAG: nucleotidyltransferase family protein [Myxococcota bacterium]
MVRLTSGDVAWAHEVGLASRLPRSAVAAVDPDSDRRARAVDELRVAATSATILAAADDEDIPVVFLKGAALVLGNLTAPGQRPMVDVDVLVAPRHAPRLQQRLVEQSGFVALDVPECEHQLRPLRHAHRLTVEIHTMIPGLRVGEGFATADELLEEGLVCGLDVAGHRAWRPVNEVLLAHALVHGLAQHGFTPLAYPMTRMLADAVDLGLTADQVDPVHRFIRGDIHRDEVSAAAVLVERLHRGVSAAVIAADDDGAARLLRHMVLGTRDPHYADALRLWSLFAVPSERSRTERAARMVARALWPTRGQLAQIYGPPASEFDRWRQRAMRPFDLVRRGHRYLLAAARARTDAT